MAVKPFSDTLSVSLSRTGRLPVLVVNVCETPSILIISLFFWRHEIDHYAYAAWNYQAALSFFLVD